MKYERATVNVNVAKVFRDHDWKGRSHFEYWLEKSACLERDRLLICKYSHLVAKDCYTCKTAFESSVERGDGEGERDRVSI